MQEVSINSRTLFGGDHHDSELFFFVCCFFADTNLSSRGCPEGPGRCSPTVFETSLREAERGEPAPAIGQQAASAL
jgi:hypothetical protein